MDGKKYLTTLQERQLHFSQHPLNKTPRRTGLTGEGQTLLMASSGHGSVKDTPILDAGRCSKEIRGVVLGVSGSSVQFSSVATGV